MVVKSATKKKLMDIGVNEMDAHVLSDDRKWDAVSELTVGELTYIIRKMDHTIMVPGVGAVAEIIDERPNPQDRATRTHHLIMLSRLLHPQNVDILNEWIRENLNPTYRCLINSWQIPITTIDPTAYVNDDLIEGLLPGDTERIVSLWERAFNEPDDWKLT
jgi:hypothetical protein